MEDNLLTTYQAAAYLGMKPTTLRKWIYVKGILKPDQRVGNYLLFRRSTLDAFQRWHTLGMDGRSSPARQLRQKTRA